MLKKIVKCSANWCAPCKMFEPIFDEISEEYKDKLEFHKIDVDGAIDDDQKFIQEMGIRSIPTTIFLDENDKVIKKIIGSVNKTNFKDLIDDELK